MIRFHRLVPVVLVPVLLTSLASGQRVESGYTSLFTGKDLNGWRYNKGEVFTGLTTTPDHRFTVQAGTILATPKGVDGKRAVAKLITTRSYNKGLVLRLQFKAAQEAIGSVVIRNRGIPVGDFIRRNEQSPVRKKFRTDDWNDLEVLVKLIARSQGAIVKGQLKLVYKNGKATVQVDGKSVDPNTTTIRVECFPRLNGLPMRRYVSALSSSGTIALQTGSGKIQFRNIRIREIP